MQCPFKLTNSNKYRVNNPIPIICKDVPYSYYEQHKKHFTDGGHNIFTYNGN